MHLYKIFAACRNIALTVSVKVRIGTPKTARLCAPKVLQEVNFPKSLFQQLYAGWTVVVHLCCSFSLWCQMAPQQSAKFRTALFGQFRASLVKDSVDNYASIRTLFSTSVTGPDAISNALNISQIRQ